VERIRGRIEIYIPLPLNFNCDFTTVINEQIKFFLQTVHNLVFFSLCAKKKRKERKKIKEVTFIKCLLVSHTLYQYLCIHGIPPNNCTRKAESAPLLTMRKMKIQRG